jgi:hypothetical protein
MLVVTTLRLERSHQQTFNGTPNERRTRPDKPLSRRVATGGVRRDRRLVVLPECVGEFGARHVEGWEDPGTRLVPKPEDAPVVGRNIAKVAATPDMEYQTTA